MGFFKEGLSKGKKVLAVPLMACMILLPMCEVAALIGLFTKNSTVMWIDVGGIFVSFWT